MWFNAGIIPTYLNFKNFGLLDTRTAIIFGFAINTYNMIIMKSFFEQVPMELEEAAFIDGANHFTIFYKIFLPIIKTGISNGCNVLRCKPLEQLLLGYAAVTG